ncbi:hypothetical protein CHUAL_010855 [Chamberlinius hualienensis]
MLDVLGSLRGHLLKNKGVVIDNNAFRLHYQLTTWLLIAFSIIVTSRQYFGDPIDCMSSSSSIPDKIWDQYCWISTTFTLPYKGEVVGADVPHPGVDNSSHGRAGKIYHQYYQWVCFVLFLQAVMFYVPHFLWKLWEGGKIRALSSGLEFAIGIEPAKIVDVVKYLKSTFGRNNMYLFKYAICELLNLGNVIGQIYFTDKFLGGAFVSYGTDVIAHSETNQENRLDPMVEVFPRVTKCNFNTYGPSGDVQKHDALCVLPINIINEKIYIFLWFWFVFVAVASVLAVVYRLLLLVTPRLRLMLLQFQSRLSEPEHVDAVGNLCNYGDWFLLNQLGQSVDDRCFDKIIKNLGSSGKSALCEI